MYQNGSPLTELETENLEKAVIEAAKPRLVGRRFLDIFGPLGTGYQVLSYDVISSLDIGSCELVPGQTEGECKPVEIQSRKTITLPTLYKDFELNWRDLEYFRQFNLPIDATRAIVAGVSTALAEDKLIFYGDKELGIDGFLTVENSLKLSMKNWNEVGAAFDDVASGISFLVKEGFYGPYVLIVSPSNLAKLSRVYHNTGVLEIEQIKKLVKEVYQTPLLDDKTAILYSVGSQNADLVVGVDMSIYYVETKGMNHIFRVLEILAPRIKRPNSILCMLGK